MTTDARTTVDSLSHVYDAANFMAERGDYDLALKLLRRALEIANVERVGRATDVAQDADLNAMDRELMARYAEYRLKLEDDARPLRQTLGRTAIIAAGVTLTFLICFGFAMWRVDALITSPVDHVMATLDGEVRAQVPRVTNRVLDVVPVLSARMDQEMQNLSLRLSDYLDKKVDATLDQRIGAIVDEKLRAEKSDASLDRRIGAIVDQKLKVQHDQR